MAIKIKRKKVTPKVNPKPTTKAKMGKVAAKSGKAALAATGLAGAAYLAKKVSSGAGLAKDIAKGAQMMVPQTPDMSKVPKPDKPAPKAKKATKKKVTKKKVAKKVSKKKVPKKKVAKKKSKVSVLPRPKGKMSLAAFKAYLKKGIAGGHISEGDAQMMYQRAVNQIKGRETVEQKKSRRAQQEKKSEEAAMTSMEKQRLKDRRKRGRQIRGSKL